jgi:phage regulator Rha-like protein
MNTNIQIKKMTSLQIAEITGKPHNDVLKAIRSMETAWQNVCKGKFSLTSNKVAMPNGGFREEPVYHLSKTECLYIATKFNDEARAKLVLRWEQLETERTNPLSQLEILQQSVNLLVQQEQRITQVESKLQVLEAKTATRPDCFTIAGYGTLHRIPLNLKQAAFLGRKASSICKERGIKTDKIPDPRFGEVKLYPAQILDEVFEMSII